MRDNIGGRPFDVHKSGDKYVVSFYPMASNAKNPDTVLFRLTVSKSDLKKIEKACA